MVLYNVGSNPVRSIFFFFFFFFYKGLFSQELLKGLCNLTLFLTNLFFSSSVFLLSFLLSFFYDIFSLIRHFSLLLNHSVT